MDTITYSTARAPCRHHIDYKATPDAILIAQLRYHY
jgi:hypothetical protein